MRSVNIVGFVILLLGIILPGCARNPPATAQIPVEGNNAGTAESSTDEKPLRIGVYDSRAIAVAWAGTSAFTEWMGALEVEYNQAKKANDQARIAELEAEADARQRKMHTQAFSTAPVDMIIEFIDDELPAIQRKAGVSMLVSKWDQETLSKYPSAEQVDVTMMLVDAFHPSEKQREFAIDVQKRAPISLEEAEKIQD